MNAIKGKCSHLQDINFTKVKPGKVTVLIGAKHTYLLVHREYCAGKDGEPVVVKTALEWLIVGGTKYNKLNMNCSVTNSNDIDVLNENITKFWSIDPYGIIPKSQLFIPDENRAFTILENLQLLKMVILRQGSCRQATTPSFQIIVTWQLSISKF